MHLPGSLSSESKVKVDNMLVKTVRNWEQGMLLNEMHSTAKKKNSTFANSENSIISL